MYSCEMLFIVSFPLWCRWSWAYCISMKAVGQLWEYREDCCYNFAGAEHCQNWSMISLHNCCTALHSVWCFQNSAPLIGDFVRIYATSHSSVNFFPESCWIILVGYQEFYWLCKSTAVAICKGFFKEIWSTSIWPTYRDHPFYTSRKRTVQSVMDTWRVRWHYMQKWWLQTAAALIMS